MQSWDLVDDERKQSADSECPRTSSKNIGELNVKLLVVVVEPATREQASVYTVEADDVRSTKEAVEDETDHTSDAVLSKHIHGIVDADPVLDCLSISQRSNKFVAETNTYFWWKNCTRRQW